MSLDWETQVATPLVQGAVTSLDRVGQGVAYAAGGMVYMCDEMLTSCEVGPAPSSDGVVQIASESANPTTFYLLTTASQVFRSTDDATSWDLVVDGKP